MLQYWHASFVHKRDIGILVIGAPNSGKTEICYHLTQYFDYFLVADDLVKITYKDGIYKGFLCNKNYLGVLYRKKIGLVTTNKSLHSGIISHIFYLYNKRPDEKYLMKAQQLTLPLLKVDIYKVNCYKCCIEELLKVC